MSEHSTQHARRCCSQERKRLIQDLRTCDYCSTSYEQYQQCYSQAARDSGERSSVCITPVS